MRAPTVILSAVLHVGLAAGLVAMAKNRELKRKAISVAVTSEKKKEAKPKPPPPPPPKQARAAPRPQQVAMLPKAGAAPAPAARPAAPVATNLTMSNDDVGPGIGLHGPAPKPAAAPAKVASALSERRKQRDREDLGPGGAPCTEEPTRPEPVFKTAIDYSVHPQAQADGVEGKLKIRFTVGSNGEVTQVDVLAGIEPGLDAAVVAAAKQWRFKPAMACGKPVAGGTYVFAARFELGN